MTNSMDIQSRIKIAAKTIASYFSHLDENNSNEIFVENIIQSLINETIDECKECVPEDALEWGMVGEVMAYNTCRQQTLDNLENMKIK